MSALDRHANGLEDRAGGSLPELEKTKERFSERMLYWFLARPWLGGVVSVAVFWGILSGELGTTDVASAQARPEKVAFWGMLVGLFAKSVLDILRNVPKNIFRQ